MRAPWLPWYLRSLVTGRPSVGWLMDLCDENYRSLMILAPELRGLQGHYLSRLVDAQDLHLEALEQTRYTSLIHLTHYFPACSGTEPDPDVVLRVYHDSVQAEVLRLREGALSLNAGDDWATLEQKWKANLFLSKWLGFCVRAGHRFGPEQRLEGVRERCDALCCD